MVKKTNCITLMAISGKARKYEDVSYTKKVFRDPVNQRASHGPADADLSANVSSWYQLQSFSLARAGDSNLSGCHSNEVMSKIAHLLFLPWASANISTLYISG